MSASLNAFMIKMNRLMNEEGMSRSQAKRAIHGRFDAECSAIKDAFNRELIQDGTFADLDQAHDYERYCREVHPQGEGYFERRAMQ